MKIDWESIKWETDDVGTSWATLADEEHNGLTLENRDGTITFHTDGNPRFDVSTALELIALCAILSMNALDQDSLAHRGRAAEVQVPEQRPAPQGERDDVKHSSADCAPGD
jgi:hypothetical protein